MVKNRKPKIVSYQLIKSNCQFDNILNALSDIIIDNIIRVRALIITLGIDEEEGTKGRQLMSQDSVLELIRSQVA